MAIIGKYMRMTASKLLGKKRLLVVDKTHYRWCNTFKMWMHDGIVRFHYEDC